MNISQPKHAQIWFNYRTKNEAGAWEDKRGNVTITAKDIPKVNTFFGDRPLDNPGYSAFKLKGGVGAGQTNDVLDVYRVEQRLKYLGFPAMGASNNCGAPSPINNEIQNFDVDGKFTEREEAALKLFEKVVRYGASSIKTGTGSGTWTASSLYAEATVLVTSEYNKDSDSYVDTITFEKVTPVIPVFGMPPATAEIQIAAEKSVLEEAKQMAIIAAHVTAKANMEADVKKDIINSQSFKLDSVGAEGLIENNRTDAQARISTDWLNAYNAPHWMQFFKSTPNANPAKFQYATSNDALKGWYNTQYGTTQKNVELYGTSWMYDLMAAKQYAPDSLKQNLSWFNGSVDANYGFTPKWNGAALSGQHKTHDLGMAFDLGVSGYIDKDTQQIRPSDPGNTAQMVAAINELEANGWNVADAVDYSSRLVSQLTPVTLKNDQVSALRDFLSLYALTQSDGQTGLNGEVLNTTAAKLFGEMITGVHIGGSKDNGENPYPSINAILGKLRISSSTEPAHQNHFHIYLKPPTPEQIGPASLLADAVAVSASDSITPTNLQVEMQGLLDYALTLIEGEELMFIMDVPAVPALDMPIVLAQVATSGAGSTLQPDYILKMCKETESTGDPRSAMRAVDPAGMFAAYIENHGKRIIDMAMLAAIKTTLLQGTQHGKIFSEVDNLGLTSYHYDPTPNYVGNDRAVFLAQFEGKVYKIVVELHVFEGVDEKSPSCPPPQLIKVTKPSSGASGYGAGYDVSSVSVAFADLAGAAVGQANTNGITLDTNAANHNWFIDTTPGSNEEFLPTSNPYEWVAKEGSAAYGKMDMLSVLLHEYGHALGIEHSADGHNYMATTLTAGVRRMPSAEELALMQQLVGEVKVEMASVSTQGSGNTPSQLPLLPLGGFGLAFLGRLRGSRYGSLNVEADLSTLVTQFAVTANEKLTNGNFSVASGMPVDNGWATQGSVDFANGAATLKETSTSQTRLNQVFVVNPRDRFLSFTIAGSVLDDVNGAPDDAFEVALLDANTGLSLAGALSLTHTDAMLNLQADGTETAASSVTRVTNPDGSRTYRVDLAGIEVGTAVNLSFDLIGFGKDNSEVTIRDVRVSGLPELHDDAATMNEDGSLAFDPFAQVDNAALLQLGSHVVDQPAHGSVTVNADGTFAYTPAADYFGTDSFSYRLNDGPLESNLATVTVTVAAVNDAPVVADVYATATEDTPLLITLSNFASDVDSATLTIQIVDGPVHGVLVTNADGTYTYTAEANYFGPDSFTYKANDSELDSNIATVSLNITPVNDAPVANDVAVYTLEDNQLVLNLLSNASDIDSSVVAQLFTVTIVAAPAHGVLSWNTDGSYTYTPDANYNGADSFTYKVNDAAFAGDPSALDSNIATVSLTVGSVNDAPEGISNTVTTLEDTPYVFQLADFGYSDANDLVGAQASRLQADGTSAIQWDNFTAVSIGSLPLVGNLALNGLAVAAGQRINAADIAAGLLTFAPAANANGASYANFSFNVQDDGGTANGGIDIDQTARTMTLNVTSVNDAPEGMGNTVTTLEDTPYVFQLADFGYSDANDLVGAQASRLQADGTSAIQWDNFTAVIISSLPLAGELALNGVAVMAGQRISVAEIAAGLLKFAPAANANGASYASFTFQVQDDGGTANGGVDTDQTARTMSIAVTAVNDAPVAVDMQAATDEDTPLTLNLLANVIDIDSAALTPIIIAGPQHGQLLYNADGSFNYVADLDYFGTDSFTYKVVDGDFANGGLESNIVTVSLNIAAVNDAPVAVSATVTGAEDTPYIFSWSDFKVSDVDSDNLFIIINELPLNGLLQYYDGLMWTGVISGQRISKTDIDAELLCFGPDANESGFAGYNLMGTGNNKQSYASFTYQADDGFLTSAIASMTLNITPVADTPALALAAPLNEFGATALLFSTSWETASNRSPTFTILPQATLEGWNVVRETGDTGQQAFILWSSGDKMKDANNTNRIVQAASYPLPNPLPLAGEGTNGAQGAANTSSGNNWLEMGDAMGLGHQTYGIERSVMTRAGASYNLSLDYAGRLGYSADYTRIAIYVDGIKIATHAGTSPANSTTGPALNWEAVNFSFIGNGANQTIRIISEASSSQCNGRNDKSFPLSNFPPQAGERANEKGDVRSSAMIDDIKLTEAMPINTGYQGSAIRLSSVLAALTDTDGSEVLGVTVGAIPTGAILTDGINSFTATDLLHLADVSGWNLSSLSITAPTGFTGTFTLTVAASATEAATGETANYALNLPVTVVPTNVTSPLVIDLNGDGVQTTAYGDSKGNFNLLNNGTAIGSGWISTQDGFLAIDTNGNGRIDDRNELFGGEIGEGFAKLKDFDSNHDGVVNAKDALPLPNPLPQAGEGTNGARGATKNFYDLKIWQDASSPLSNSLPQAGERTNEQWGKQAIREADARKNNLQLSGNHQTDAGELKYLSEHSINDVNVNNTIVPEQQNGNWLLERGTVTFKDGHTAAMADAYFEIGKPAQNPLPTPLPQAGEGANGAQGAAQTLNRSSASITLRSEQAQHKQILGIPPGATLNNVEGFDKFGSYVSPFAADRNAQNNAVIDWNTKANNTSETNEELKKKRKGAANWFKDFLGLAEPVSLTESSGLSVTQQKAEETKQPFVERRRAVNADGSRVKNDR